MKKNYEVFAAVLACIGIVCIIGLIYIAGLGINSFRYRNRNYIENAILEIAPEGTKMSVSGGGSRGRYSFSIDISPDYVTIDQVGGVIHEITDVLLKATGDRRVRRIPGLWVFFGEERGRYVSWRLRSGGYGYTGGGNPDNIGVLFVAIEGQTWSTITPVTEVEKMIEAVFTEEELTAYISERLHQLLPEGSTTFIRVEPMWRYYYRRRHSSLSDLFESGEYKIWDTSKIYIEFVMDPEQVSLNDFGEYVEENSPMVHSLFEELSLVIYSLEFWHWEYSVTWSSQSEWFNGSLRVGGERYVDISIDEMRSIIDRYLDTGL